MSKSKSQKAFTPNRIGNDRILRKQQRRGALRRSLALERLEARQMLSATSEFAAFSPWQNPSNRFDVNDDGIITAADVLVGVNRLNEIGAGTLTSHGSDQGGETMFVDTDGDGDHTAADVLAVINMLNTDRNGPTIQTDLLLDTAAGIGASRDNITADATIVGVVRDVTGVSSLSVTLNGREEIPVAFDREGNFEIDPALTFDDFRDGSHQLRFRAVDGQGNVSFSEAISVSFDTEAPTIFVESVRTNDAGDAVLVEGASVDFMAGTAVITADVALEAEIDVEFDEQGRFQFLVPAVMADAGISFCLHATDTAGNQSDRVCQGPFYMQDVETESDEVALGLEAFGIAPGTPVVEVADGLWFYGQGIPPDQLILPVIDNADAADTTNADQLREGGGLGLNLTGKGVSVGVWDGGLVLASHQEFGDNVRIADGSQSLSGHATHVAGTIAASGVHADARGMAPNAEIVSFDFHNDLVELVADGRGLQLSNHSYGRGTGWTTTDMPVIGEVDVWMGDRSRFDSEAPGFGKYNKFVRDWDQILFENDHLLSIWAAGNDREEQFRDRLGDGTYYTYLSDGIEGPGYYRVSSRDYPPPPSDGNGGTGFDSLPIQQVAKNNLVVGAVNDINVDPYSSADIVMSTFSSWGPTDDGRIKPDVVGNGVGVFSTNSNGDASYATANGTSMAAPNVTGTAALLVEHYRNLFGQWPKSATTKGLLIHTAQDAGNVGPDYIYGWGLVDGAAAAQFLTNASSGNASSWYRQEIHNGGESWTVVADGSEPLLATIVWTDPEGDAHGAELDEQTPVLVNDLDLWITGPDGTHFPWTLDPANPATPAVRTEANRLDNVEQVLIDVPVAGNYTIHVGHAGDAFTQAYSLLVSGARQTSDTIALDVSPTVLTVEEGGTGSFNVRLTAAPVSDVNVVTVRSEGDSDLEIVDGANLVFTPGNWDVPQPVTVAANPDIDNVNGTAVFVVSSHGLADQEIVVHEDDTTQSVPVITPQQTISGDLEVAWTGGTKVTEVWVFADAETWTEVLEKKKVFSGKSNLVITGLESGTYFVAARSWWQDENGQWRHGPFSQRVEHVVEGVPTNPRVLPQEDVSGDLSISWIGGQATTEVWVFTHATNWTDVAAKRKVFGDAKNVLVTGLDEGTYYVAARAWKQDDDGNWLASPFGERVEYIVDGLPPNPRVLPQEEVGADLTVSWIGGEATTEVWVFTHATDWTNVAAKETVFGGARDVLIAGLDEGTYYVAARAWLQDDSGVWLAGPFSQRVEYRVVGVSSIPRILPQESIGDALEISWDGQHATTEIWVSTDETNWDNVAAKKTVFGGARSLLVTGLDAGTYYVAGRAWWQDEDDVWQHGVFGRRETYVVETAAPSNLLDAPLTGADDTALALNSLVSNFELIDRVIADSLWLDDDLPSWHDLAAVAK